MQHLGLDSCIVTEKIVKLSCTIKSLYFTMEPKRCYLVPGYQVTFPWIHIRHNIFIPGFNFDDLISVSVEKLTFWVFIKYFSHWGGCSKELTLCVQIMKHEKEFSIKLSYVMSQQRTSNKMVIQARYSNTQQFSHKFTFLYPICCYV